MEEEYKSAKIHDQAVFFLKQITDPATPPAQRVFAVPKSRKVILAARGLNTHSQLPPAADTAISTKQNKPETTSCQEIASNSRATATPAQIKAWVRNECGKRYYDANGKLLRIPEFSLMKRELGKIRPGHLDIIEKALAEIDEELVKAPLSDKESQQLFSLAQAEADKLSWTSPLNYEKNRSDIAAALSIKRPDIHPKIIRVVATNIQTLQIDLEQTESRQQEPRKEQGSLNQGEVHLQIQESSRKQEDARRVARVRRSARQEERLQRQTAEMAAAKLQQTTKQSSKLAQWPKFPPGLKDSDFDLSTTNGIESWAQWYFCEHAFDTHASFRGYQWLKDRLISLRGNANMERVAIIQAVNKLRKPGHEFSFPTTDAKIVKVVKARNNVTSTSNATANKPQNVSAQPALFRGHPTSSVIGTNGRQLAPAPMPTRTSARISSGSQSANRIFQTANCRDNELLNEYPTGTAQPHKVPGYDLLARKLNQAHANAKLTENQHTSPRKETGNTTPEAEATTACNDIPAPNFEAMELLLEPDSFCIDEDANEDDVVRHAPLFDEDIIRGRDTAGHLPQYGLMGTHDQNPGNWTSKMFLNTNIPFSAFVCGVQGSGKSHTTSCILENCLIPTDNIGKLQKPLSALVFSYGPFSGEGAGFSISEAAFLGAPNPQVPFEAHATKINVLVSPTNYIRISKLYNRLPNVRVVSFKLNPRNLDIDLMLTLMNVDETEKTPLYMAQVQQILRRMATTSESFDYKVFKRHLYEQQFDHTQRNMLQIRLDVLESFLDLDGSYKEELLFKPGEINIMDMSCPFVDANTACIMFKVGLKRYLQSGATGKMVVLDEAHKYMLDVPGAKALNETLLQTIRLQRHFGVRVAVSTQEPTLLTDLIALCSITIIHRFSSPQWFSAIKRHIHIQEQYRETLLEQIEGLKTGAAIVYCPNAVLGENENGKLEKGTGRMIQVKMRKRITVDGGQSILAV